MIVLNNLEKEIILLLLDGYTSKEMALELAINKRKIDRVVDSLQDLYESKNRINLIVNILKEKRWFNSFMTDVKYTRANELPSLSIRQIQILHGVLKGNTSNEIAVTMYIDRRSVENARQRIIKLWNINNKTELVVISIAKGYLNYKL